MSSQYRNQNLMDLLYEKSSALRQHAEESWQDHGEIAISLGEWNFLAQVQKHQETITGIAQRAGMSRQAAHKFCTNLREKELVEIVEKSPRERLVVLTPLGEECFAQYISMQQTMEESVRQAVGGDNVDLLKQLLTKKWLAPDEREAQ